jgi:hypothetical protein
VTQGGALAPGGVLATASGDVAWNAWIRDNIPTTMPWAPFWIYANSVSMIRWHGLSNPYSVGVVFLPFVAGYVAYRKTDWGPRWSALAGFGTFYVLGSIQAFIASLFSGGH